jgi:hypothetical protein
MRIVSAEEMKSMVSQSLVFRILFLCGKLTSGMIMMKGKEEVKVYIAVMNQQSIDLLGEGCVITCHLINNSSKYAEYEFFHYTSMMKMMNEIR